MVVKIGGWRGGGGVGGVGYGGDQDFLNLRGFYFGQFSQTYHSRKNTAPVTFCRNFITVRDQLGWCSISITSVYPQEGDSHFMCNLFLKLRQ